MHELPKFSVCVELYNREKTITNVLAGIQNQIFRDFELIIVDNGSTDKTFEICNKFLNEQSNLAFKLIKQSYKQNEIDGWNSPLEFARGEYVAICEGDDIFRSDHLQSAYELLITNSNIGLYVGGSKLSNFNTTPKIFLHHVAQRKLLNLQWCPAPSQIIFKRIDRGGRPYKFDNCFVWAGEFSLYTSILNDEYDVLENHSKNYVDRGYRFYLKDDFHMKDIIQFVEKNKAKYSNVEWQLVETLLAFRALEFFITNLFFFKFKQIL
jgi:glycosyltransferase involved in cell wall biosynthesis